MADLVLWQKILEESKTNPGLHDLVSKTEMFYKLSVVEDEDDEDDEYDFADGYYVDQLEEYVGYDDDYDESW